MTATPVTAAAEASSAAGNAATKRDDYLAMSCRAVSREAAELVTEGDPATALWSLVYHTEHLARISASEVTLDEAWQAFEDCWHRIVADLETRR